MNHQLKPTFICLLLNYARFPINSPLQTVKSYNITSFSWDDVAYGMYDTAGFIASASQYVHDLYSNALEYVLSSTTACEENIFFVLGT